MSLLSRFSRDETGAVSLEFVIWAPILLFWLVVSVSAFGAFSARYAAANAAYTVTDVMARQTDVDDAFLDRLQVLHANLLPGTSPQKTLRISSIAWDAANERFHVLWSRGMNEPPLKSEWIPDTGLPPLSDGESLIVVETIVPYTFFSDWLGMMGAEITAWRHVTAARPRFVAAVAKTDEPGNGTNFPRPDGSNPGDVDDGGGGETVAFAN